MPTETTKDIRLEFCSSADIKDFERRHYVERMPEKHERLPENPTERRLTKSKDPGEARGHHGQQIHFLIHYKTEVVGAISGGSAVYATGPRDRFFGITKNNREQVINGIIDNTLFRLEKNEPNLATRCLAIWRRTVVGYWKYLYDVEPYGFETFVEPGWSHDDISYRNGTIYKADNWVLAGNTSGSTKDHIAVGLTGGVQYGDRIKGKFHRRPVPTKLVFCKWVGKHQEPLWHEYRSSWRAKTPEEKALAKERIARRRRCMGTSDVSEVLGSYLSFGS